MKQRITESGRVSVHLSIWIPSVLNAKIDRALTKFPAQLRSKSCLIRIAVMRLLRELDNPEA